MVSVFLAVIHDLFLFVVGREERVVESVSGRAKELPAPPTVVSLQPLLALSQIEAPVSPVVTPVEMPQAVETVPLHEPAVMYVSNLAGAQCLAGPAVEFDTIQTTYPYGTAVTVASYTGNYARIQRGTMTGWLRKDDITPHKSEVWPTFVEWVLYGATTAVTIRVRALLADSFGAGALSLPLQAGEYVTLRLLTDNRTIAWPDDRPRLPGMWQKILKGVQGIHNSIMPKTDSIMEWQSESDGGRLAYVESVSPDNTITTTCVGLIVAGQYTKQVWTQEEWRELRPVFIEVD